MANYLEQYKKMCLLEYINPTGGYMQNEADDDQQMPDAGADPMGGDAPDMGGAPQGGDPMGGGAPQGADPMAGGDPSMGGGEGQTPQGFAPQGADPSMGGDPSMGADPMAGGDPMAAEGGDDEVIDVDELVDAQDETQDDVKKLLKKFSAAAEKLGPMVDSILSSIENTNAKVDSLEQEMERRNPTPVEKLTLRSAKAYPFNDSVKDYWDEKEATSNYSTEDDNNGADEERYKITKADIDSMNDYNGIARELGASAPRLSDILNY